MQNSTFRMCLSTERVCFSQEKKSCFKNGPGLPPDPAVPHWVQVSLERGSPEPQFPHLQQEETQAFPKEQRSHQPGPASAHLAAALDTGIYSPCLGRNRKPAGEKRKEGEGVKVLCTLRPKWLHSRGTELSQRTKSQFLQPTHSTRVTKHMPCG
jgi:hypothetical protein